MDFTGDSDEEAWRQQAYENPQPLSGFHGDGLAPTNEPWPEYTGQQFNYTLPPLELQRATASPDLEPLFTGLQPDYLPLPFESQRQTASTQELRYEPEHHLFGQPGVTQGEAAGGPHTLSPTSIITGERLPLRQAPLIGTNDFLVHQPSWTPGFTADTIQQAPSNPGIQTSGSSASHLGVPHKSITTNGHVPTSEGLMGGYTVTRPDDKVPASDPGVRTIATAPGQRNLRARALASDGRAPTRTLKRKDQRPLASELGLHDSMASAFAHGDAPTSMSSPFAIAPDQSALCPYPLVPEALPSQATITGNTAPYYSGQVVGAPPQQQVYRCPHEGCTKTYDSLSKVQRHQKRHDGDKMHRYKCPVAKRNSALCKHPGFEKRYDAERHLLIHFPPQFECEECEVRFHRIENLERHEDTCGGQPRKRAKTNNNTDSFESPDMLEPAGHMLLSNNASLMAATQAMQRSVSDIGPLGSTQQLPVTPARSARFAARSSAGLTGSSSGLQSAGSISSTSRPPNIFTPSRPPGSTPLTSQTPGSIDSRAEHKYPNDRQHTQGYFASSFPPQ